MFPEVQDKAAKGERVGSIHRMNVLPEFRGLGIAKRLLEKMVDHAYEYNLSKIVFITSEYQSDARRMYEKAGWVQMKEIVRRFGVFRMRFNIFEYERKL